MTSEQYGTYIVYLSWLQILTIFTSLYLFNGVTSEVEECFFIDSDKSSEIVNKDVEELNALIDQQTRKLKSLARGLVLGGVAISLLTFLASISGTVTFAFNGLDWQLFPVILPLFIQCTAEELLLRGYVPAVVGSKHSWDVVSFVSGGLFIFHHILNLEYFGFNTMFCLNVFLMGVLLCLLVRAEGNFWIVCGFHTAWNYMQTYIFGVTISGNPSTIGVFQGILNGGNGFFEEAYGYEGSITATVLVTTMILGLIYYLRRKTERVN